MFNALTILLKKSDTIEYELFNVDVWMLLFRLAVNFLFLTIIIRYLYYPKTRRKDYFFTYYIIGTITFFLCFSLKKLDIDTGMGLGLFAILGIIRYRTDAIEIKEMTYLFLVIGLSVTNSLSSNRISITEMIVINLVVTGLTFGMENLWLLKHETRKTINYEKIALIKPEHYNVMLTDLETRTGLKINRFEVGKIDFLNDTAQVRIFYYDSDQTLSDYTNSEN